MIEIPAIQHADESDPENQIVQDVHIVNIVRGDDSYGWDENISETGRRSPPFPLVRMSKDSASDLLSKERMVEL